MWILIKIKCFASLLVIFLAFFNYSSSCACCESYIFLSDHEKLGKSYCIATEAGISGGAIALFDDARFQGNQRSLEYVIRILESDLDYELPFYINKSIARKEFKAPSMAKQLAELESIRRAKNLILQKAIERKRISEVYLAAFPHMKDEWRYADFYFIYESYYDSDLLEKIQNAQCLLAKEGIIHPHMSYFMRNPENCMPDKRVVNKRFLSEFWNTLELRKLDIVMCFGDRCYNLLEYILFEKDPPTTETFMDLYKHYWQDYSILIALLPRILHEAKSGNEMCMEAACFIIQDIYDEYSSFNQYEPFVKFVKNIEEDKCFMDFLIAYFREKTMLNAQKAQKMTWKYKCIALEGN